MKRKMQKLMSGCLIIAMLVSLFPIQTFATEAESVSFNEVLSTDTVSSGDATVTVIAPIVTDEAEEHMQPMLFSMVETPVYISKEALSVSLPEIAWESSISAEGARIQAVDESGTVVAQTRGLWLYSDTSEGKGTELFLLKQLPEGEYPLQLVYGDVETIQTIALNYVLTVVDAPVITYGYISGLKGETAESLELTLRIAGYKGDWDKYSFALMDEEGVTINCTSEYTRSYESDYGVAGIIYSLTPEQKLASNTKYYLQISVTEGELYLTTSDISATAYKQSSDEIAVLSVVPNEGVIGGLTITAGGVEEGTEYTIIASVDSGDLYKGNLTPFIRDGIGNFDITLSKNDMILPLSAYGSEAIRVEVRDAEGNYDSGTYSNSDGYASQSINVSLEKADENVYSFELLGRNLLQELYESENWNFSLKKYDQQYITIGTAANNIKKESYIENESVYYKFSGTIETTEELENGTYYYLFNGDESLSGTSNVVGGAVTALDVFSWSSRLMASTSNGRVFHFNFGKLPFEVIIGGGGATAIAQLYDQTDSKVVAETEEMIGVWNEERSGYQFKSELTKPDNLDDTHSYEIRFVTNGETIGLDSYSSAYAELKYDSEVKAANYFSIQSPVFEGDTTITIQYSGMKNIDLAYFENNPIDIYCEATESGIVYDSLTPSVYGNYCYVQVNLSKGVNVGKYTVEGSRNFTVYPAGTTVLGTADENATAQTITISNCHNLNAETYTGILYDTAANGYRKLADLSIEKIAEDTLVTGKLPNGLKEGSYTLEVWQDGIYLKAISIYIDWGDEVPTECIIEGYNRSNSNQIVYQTDEDVIRLYTYYQGYAYVRYSEDSTFTGVAYKPVRDYYDQTLSLSDGAGVKTIYVQFKTSDGTESEVFSWQCEKVENLPEPAISATWVTVDGNATTVIPDNAEFVVNLVSTSQLTSAYVEFSEAGDVYYNEYPLEYKGETQSGTGGYLFQATLNSGDSPFYYYEFDEIIFTLTDLTGGTTHETRSQQITFGENRIILDAWKAGNYVYTNQDSFEVTGTATPNSNVTVIWGEYNNYYGSYYVSSMTEAETDENGKFSAVLEDLSAGSENIYAFDDDGLEYTGYGRLTVDKTVPTINSLKAVLADGGNVAVTWTYTESNLKTFLLYRDDVLIKGSETDTWGYDDTNYIVANGAGATFTVIAVDEAGNRSEPKSVTVADEESPTAPGIPELTAHGTKSVSFDWEAATDNVAVYQYEIYRGEEKVGTVSYKELSFTDNGLEEGKGYIYSVYALDRAGNKSAAAQAEFSTATLKINETIELKEEYVKENYADGVTVYLYVDDTDTYYDMSDVSAKMKYQKDTDIDWSEVSLNGTYDYKYGNWEIEELPIGNYNVKFVVTDADGTQKESAIFTTSITQDLEAPLVSISKPAMGSVYGGSKMQEVSFVASDNVGVERVELQYSIDGGTTFLQSDVVANDATSKKTFIDVAEFAEAATLGSGDIVIKVLAYDKRENKGESESITFTLDNMAPDAPTDFYVGGDKNKITVMWKYPAQAEGSDFSKFNVYRSTAADGEFECVERLDTIGYYDTAENGIEVETSYYYYVTAVDKYGNESEATITLGGVLIDDDLVPEIHSVLPEDNSELQKEVTIKVSATDNYRLQKCVIEYQAEGATEWIPVTTVENEDTTRSHIYTYEWDISNLTVGTYQIRLSVYDVSGNEPAVKIVPCTIKAYNAPVAPTLTANVEGHKEVHLNWSYSGDKETLNSFALYRSDDGAEYSYVKGLTAETMEYVDKVSFEGESHKFYYKMVARDKYDESATSQSVEVLAVSADFEAPVAIIAPDEFTYAAVGEKVSLSAAASTDNDSIAKYEWNFGDGETATGIATEHAYDAAGEYTVQLKVTDVYDNSTKATVTIKVVDLSAEDTQYTKFTLKICDAIDVTPVADAEVIISDDNYSDTFKSNSKGIVNCVVPNGSYTVNVCADGYIVRTITLQATGGNAEHTIGLTEGSIMSGQLNAYEMTYDEIVAAGIDPNAEGNQHVYKFEATLNFTVGLQTYEIPYTIFKNAKGELVGREGGGFMLLGGDGSGVGGGGTRVGVFPTMSENFALVIYGEAHWLKEMYHVELVVLNHSKTDTLEEVMATLELPEGLSFAEMNSGVQSATQELGTVDGNSMSVANWYVRGDKEGEYYLSANVNAISMPYGEVIKQTFKTTDTLKVYAGSALHMTIIANDYAERGAAYPVTFRLENVSDKPIYNLSFGITGVEQFKIIRMGTKEGDLLIESQDFGDQFIREVRELPPGGYIEIEMSTTIWFNSVAEVGEMALKSYLNTKGLGVLGNYVNVVYYLQDVSVVSLEGSTTEIPYTIVKNKVDRPNLLINMYKDAKALYKGETPSQTLGETAVEVMGYDLPIYLQEACKMLVGLQQGSTQYDVSITINDGKLIDGKLQNENFSITSSQGFEGVVDVLNTVKIKAGENGDIEINALKPGEGEITISCKSDKFNFEYDMPIYIDGEEVEVNWGVSMDEKTGEYRINSDVIQKIIGAVQGEEKLTFEENPYLWFASHLKLDIVATDDATENIITLDEDTLKDLMAETVLSHVTIDSEIAELTFDRATFEKVLEAKTQEDAVTILIKEVGDEIVLQKFGSDRPLYEFLITVGDDLYAESKTVSNFGEGEVQVEIPYELQDGESAEDIEIHRVKEDGSYELVPSKYDSAEGLVKFTTDQFSYYRIGLSNSQSEDADDKYEDSNDGSSDDSLTENDANDEEDDDSTESEVSNDAQSSEKLETSDGQSKEEAGTTDSSDTTEKQEESNPEIYDEMAKEEDLISDKTEDISVEMKVEEIEMSELNAEQLASMTDKEVIGVFSISVLGDAETIKELNSGKLTIRIPFDLKEGMTADDYEILRVDENGVMKAVEMSYIDGMFEFEGDASWEYVIVEKTKEPSAGTGEEALTPITDENDSNFIWWIVGAIAVLVGILIVIIILKERKEKEEYK